MRNLWLFLPDEAMVLVIAGIGLALILGLIRRQAALALVGAVAVSLLVGPFVEAVIGALPGWALFVLLVFLAFSLFRASLSLFLGSGAADHAVGSLAASVIRFCFGLLFLPFRVLGWMIRRP